MKAQGIVALMLVGCACCAARGDGPLTMPRAQSSGLGANHGALHVDLAATNTLEHFNWLLDGSVTLSPAAVSAPDLPVVDDRASETTISLLPHDAGSTAIAFWALGSLGALQAGRSLRRAQLGATPEWYHTGAYSVGGAAPLNLDFDDWPALAFAEPTADSAPPNLGPPPSVPCSGGQCVLIKAAPRGPPL